MNGFTLLWGKILDSSLWVRGSKETRLVWITMLAMRDYDGVVRASVVGLADRAKVSEDECKEALRIFLSPDADDTSKVEDGRRIREVPGGWQIVNHDLYRFSTEAKREFWRVTKAEQREKKEQQRLRRARIRAEAASREKRGVEAINDGDLKKADEIAAEGLPSSNGTPHGT